MLYGVKVTVCSEIHDAQMQLWVERRVCNVEPPGFKRLIYTFTHIPLC